MGDPEPLRIQSWTNNTLSFSSLAGAGGPYAISVRTGTLVRSTGDDRRPDSQPSPPKTAATRWGNEHEDTAQDVTCDAACFAKMNVTAGVAYKVRDLWAHADVGTVKPPLTYTAKGLIPHGGVALFKFTPQQAQLAQE